MISQKSLALMQPASGVHNVSNEGYLKEGHLYESRIDYPESLGHRIFDIISQSNSKRILEVAAGTGKLTRYILMCDSFNLNIC